MDISVTETADPSAWALTDLLGRPMGSITEAPAGEFRIVAAGQAVETMKTMKLGPFSSLDAALAEIERFTRGVCRRVFQKPEAGDTAG